MSRLRTRETISMTQVNDAHSLRSRVSTKSLDHMLAIVSSTNGDNARVPDHTAAPRSVEAKLPKEFGHTICP